MTKSLTPQKKKILDFINFYSNQKGYSPSLEEIKKKLKLRSVSTIHQHLEEMKKSGYLKKTKNQKRSIDVKNVSSMTKISLIGFIAAGGPIEAIRNPQNIDVPRNMLSVGSNYYALRIAGTSMIDDGIFNNDIVIVREQPTVEDGEKAVAYLPDKNAVTLKRIYHEKNRIKLVPANPKMKPLYETNVEIQGKVVGVLRKEV